MERRQFLGRAALTAPALVGLATAAACSSEGEPTRVVPSEAALDAPFAKVPYGSVSVRDFGAKGDGRADDSDAVAAAVKATIGERINDGQVVRELYFPAGVYRVTRSDCLMYSPTDGKSDEIRGLRIRGEGKRTSEVFFDSDAGPSDDRFSNNLMTAANRLRATRVSSISFRSENPHLNWLYCWSRDSAEGESAHPEYGTGSNQDFVLTDVEWRGSWNRVVGLDGDVQSNLNSEWAFDNCHVSNSATFADAFLHSGMSPEHQQQDQFLNFWFTNCKFEYAAGTLLKFTKGGFVNVTGGSWIAGIESTEPSLLLSMPEGDHFSSVQNLSMVGTRIELRHEGVALLDCAWAGPSAHLSFQNISDGSQSFRDWAPDAQTVTLRARGGAIPTIRFVNSELMGFHVISGAEPGQGKVIYEACNFANYPAGGVGPDAFLRFEDGSASYRFIDCYGVPDSSG